MEAARATEIQQALIKNGYMTGEPSGVWDSQSAAAMQKFQGDNGWQTKITPDSRALIKLGLGPQQDAMVTSPNPQ
jgi:peptidoglycan hydrolase-like protein with peptidoglycan-binding domain